MDGDMVETLRSMDGSEKCSLGCLAQPRWAVPAQLRSTTSAAQPG